ncbi:AGE family epimerase/isomerase [bacterium]|nr:AGE family epimerase/isomerase [bacterium]
MKRRTFISSSATAIAVLSHTAQSEAASEKSGTKQAGTPVFAGMSLKELRNRYHSVLFDEYLPFMDKHIIDHEKGGFMCNASPDGTLISTNKRAVYEGRGIWVYSCLYNTCGREKKYLEVARKSVEFLLRNKPEGDSMWPGSFDKDGNPTSPPGTSVNADLYIADGFAEFARATDDRSYRELAREITLKCLRVYDRDDYGTDVGKGYLGPDAPLTPGIRIMDDWMLFLRAATRLLEQQPDPDMEALAARCVDTIMNNYYNPRFGLVTEILNHDHSFPDNDYGQVVNFGNDFQALWHVMDEAARIKNRELFDTAAERLRRHIGVAWDDVYGGVFTMLRHVDENRWELGKAHYAQVETLVGLMMITEHTGADWTYDLFTQIYSYIEETFLLKKYGYPLWILGSDRKVTFNPKSTRIGNFHQPRHLLLNLAALNRIIERNGRVSGVFG